ncbi:hypothetical protein BsWGS_28851 [Bradybaena similaris]
MEDKTACSRINEMAGPDNTQSEDKTALIHHTQAPVDDCAIDISTSSVKHENSSQISEGLPSLIGTSTKLGLTSENCQLHHLQTPVKHAQISGTSIDCTVGFTGSGIQAGDTPRTTDVCDPPHTTDVCDPSCTTDVCDPPCMADVCDPGAHRYLDRHTTSHTEEKCYLCDVCGASFSHINRLKYHLRTHVRERPYKCILCGAFFTSRGALKTHKKIHTGDKPYKCDVCGASFSRSTLLKQHKRRHTGEKPYKCDDCGAFFTYINNINAT